MKASQKAFASVSDKVSSLARWYKREFGIIMFIAFYVLHILLVILTEADLTEPGILSAYFFSLTLFAAYATYYLFSTMGSGGDHSLFEDHLVARDKARRERGATLPGEFQDLLRDSAKNLTLVEEQKDIERRRYANLGVLFITASFAVPIFTWWVSFTLYESGDDLKNLWALTFTGMTTGWIGISIGVTLLRHSARLGTTIEDLDKYRSFLERINIALLMDGDDSFSVTVKEKILTALISIQHDSDMPSNQETGLVNDSMIKSLVNALSKAGASK